MVVFILILLSVILLTLLDTFWFLVEFSSDSFRHRRLQTFRILHLGFHTIVAVF